MVKLVPKIKIKWLGLPWDFKFEVKFYPPEPATLAEDRTRHLLCLQVRRDVSTGKLPATLTTHALLGSYVAQSVQGDYEPSLQYIDFLRSYQLAPVLSETLFEKVEELHKHHKGETSAEADLHYLENAKKLSMYGVHLFPAKDGKGVPVQIGINAHGINIYLDQIRVHRFLWQNIIKIGYRRNIFVIKVKPGDLEKNDTTAAFKLSDYEAAKRVWKCGVEHHTFFRLIQPEGKPHKGLFRWSSARFRYQGRTQFQSKMASQMFCNSQPIQRSQSVRLVQNDRDVTVPTSINQTLPLMYSENGTSRELGWNSNASEMVSKNIYSTHAVEATKNDGSNTILNGAEVGNSNITSGKLHGNVHPSAIFTTSTISTTNSSAVNTTVTTATVIDQSFYQKTPIQTYSLHISPHSTKINQATTLSSHQFSDDGFHGQSHSLPDNLCENRSNISALQKGKDMGFLPVQDTAVVYHPGHYEEEVAGNNSRQLREPPIEPGDDFVLVHRPKLGSTGKIFHQSGSETDILVKEEDIETYPIRYFADVYHSGFSRSTSGNKDLEVFGHEKYLGRDNFVNKLKVDSEKYPKNENFPGHVLYTERSTELPAEPLREYAYVYNQGYYDSVSANQTDIDEKGNLRYWFRCYTKPEKSQAKEKNAEVKVKTEKNTAELIRGGHFVGKSEFLDGQENKLEETARIHVKQSNYYNTEPPEEKLQQAVCATENKLVTSDLKAAKSPHSAIKKKAYDSTESKQSCRLFISASGSHCIRPEAYGLPSTSYNEPLHSIKREEELPFSPIHEHAAVYHSGISAIKVKKPRKFLVRKEQQKATSSEGSTDEEVPIDESKKPAETSVVFGGGTTTVAVSEQEAVSVRKYKVHDMEETKYFDPVQAGSREYSEVPKYIREIKDNERDITLAESGQKMSLEHGKTGCAVDNTPPAVKLSRKSEISFQPFHLAVSAQNLPPNYRAFKRAKHGGTVEFVSKENVDPESYRLERTPYHGPLETTECLKGLPFAPINEYSAIYHPGNTYVVKSRKFYKRKDAPEERKKEKPGSVKAKKIDEMHLTGDEIDDEQRKKEKDNKENLSTKYEDQQNVATYTAKIVCKSSEKKNTEVGKHPFRHRMVAGDVEIVGKASVKPETYNLVTVPYDGPMSRLEYEKELSFTPIQKYSAAYHSGISYKKARMSRDSSSESSLSSSSSSSSSSTNSFISHTQTKSEKKAVPHMRNSDDKDDTGDESAKNRSFFSFWRKSTTRNEKEEGFADIKKQKLKASPKSTLTQQESTSSVYFTASQEALAPSRDLSTLSLKDSVNEPMSNLNVENRSKKMSARLYLKGEPATITEYGEDKSKGGKFDAYHFWRSADKGSKVASKKLVSENVNICSEDRRTHVIGFDSLEEEANIGLAIKDEKEVTKKNEATELEVTELSRSKDMKEEPLKYALVMPSADDVAKIKAKKSALIYLKCDSELPEDLPLNVNSTPEISGQQQTATASVVSSLDQANYSRMLLKADKPTEWGLTNKRNIASPESTDCANEHNLKKPQEQDGIRYMARIAVKREIRSGDENLKEDAGLGGKGIDVASRSGFEAKEFHLRGAGSNLEGEIVDYSGSKHGANEDTHTESGGSVTETNESSNLSNGDGALTHKMISGLKIRQKTLNESDVVVNESKKDSGRGTKSGFFSSFWRGSKPKSNEQLKEQKSMTGSDLSEIGLKPAETSSEVDEPKYNILQKKIIFDEDYKVDGSAAGTASQIGKQAELDFIPVYDFSYVPNFAATAQNVESVPATNTIKDGGEKQIELITTTEDQTIMNHGIKDVEEYNNMPTSLESETDKSEYERSAVNAKQTVMGKTFVSELTWKKLDTAETERHKDQCAIPKIEIEKLVHQSGISDGETSDEPYKFTQTPPDLPVPMVYLEDSKRSGSFMEQIKRQVTQVVTKASPSSDKKKKFKKEKQMKKDASSHEGEGSNPSENELIHNRDSSFFNQSQENTDKPGKLSFEEIKVDDRQMVLEKFTERKYDPKDVKVLPAVICSTNTEGSLSHTKVGSWQETVNEPETVITSIDHHGNITRKTVKTRKVTHTAQKQTYHANNDLNQNGESVMSFMSLQHYTI
uniref:FERM domain-containing protein n=1 Tax=Setaria digitata TaxID=48799 RepID=A0A915PES1_9BILA